MRLVNLTPHAISLSLLNGEIVTLPSEGNARISTSPGESSYLEGIPVPLVGPSVFGPVMGLPEPQEGVIYVTSMLVAQRVLRPDVVSPDTGPTALRVDGQIVAVRNLVRWV